MHSFSITIPNYAAEFQRRLSVPVIEDEDLPLASGLSAALAPGTDFSFTIDDAILAGDRFLAIHGRPPNPVQMVRDWVNVLRWEVSTYWESPRGHWYDVRPNPPTWFSAEHPKRSGELLAHGIAILFLERRLRVARSRFFFLEGADARPDFLVRLQRSAQRAVLLTDRSKMGLEVRSRYRVRQVPTTDKPKLLKKKQAMTNTVAVYCAYGAPTEKRGSARTKIVLADPPGEGRPAEDAEVAEIIFGHYLGVAGRLGLWDARDALDILLGRLAAGGDLPAPQPLGPGRPRAFGLPIETVQGVRYVGRFFSELLVRRDQGLLSPSDRDVALKTGRFGRVFFAGIREDLLRAVVAVDLAAVEGFFDDRALRKDQVDEYFSSDGTVRIEQEEATPETSLGRQIEASLRAPRRRR